MNKLIFFFALSLYTQLAYTQLNTTISENYQSSEAKYKVFASDDEFAYSVKIRDRSMLILQKMDKKSLKVLKSNIVENALPRDSRISQLIILGDMCYLSYITEGKKNVINIHVTAIDYKTQTVLQNQKLISSVEEGIYTAPYSPYCNLYSSGDNTTLLLKYRPRQPKDKSQKAKTGLFVLDNNLKKIGGGEIIMPSQVNELMHLEYSISNDGKINITGYNSSKKSYQYLTIDQDKILNSVSTDDERFNPDNEFPINTNKTKIVAGIENNEFYIINFKNSEKQSFKIPSEMIPTFKNGGEKKLMLYEAIEQADGGFLIIAQAFWELEYSDGGYAGTRAKNFYMVRTTVEGKLRWIKRINKEKYTHASSLTKSYLKKFYIYFYQDGKHYLFFIDKLKEFKNNEMLCVYSIDDESKASKFKVVFGIDKIDKQKIYHFKTANMVDLGNQRFGAEVYTKKGGAGDVMISFKVE